MRFRFSELGIEALGLPAAAGREFDGPPTSRGLMGGIPLGVQRWAERELARIGYDNVRVVELDVLEARVLYYVLAIRAVDHKLLPIDRFPDLAGAYFEMVPHVVREFDADGDCAECHAVIGASWHLPSDLDAVPPTSVPAGTTGTLSP